MRGKASGIVFGMMLLFCSFGAAAQYWSSADVAAFFYGQASHNNAYAISRTLNYGYDIDAVDGKGNTAFCIAIYKNDAKAMRLLRYYGANTRHPCVKAAMRGRSSLALNTGYTLGAVAVGGAAVAAVAAGGGGGGHKKSSAGDDTGGSGSGDDTGGSGSGDDTGGSGSGDDTGGSGSGDDTGGSGSGDNTGGSGSGDDTGGSGSGDDTGGSGSGDNTGGSGSGDDTGGSGSGDDTGGSGSGDDTGGSGSGDDTGGSGSGDDTGGSGSGDDTGGSGSGDDTGGSGSGDDTGGSGSGDDTGGSATSLDSSYFETNEYNYGKFLPLINASKAYARLYRKDENGNLISNLQDVSVGIIDTGVYADNTELAGTEVTGISRDYGPCRNGDTSNCWAYRNSRAVFYDENGNISDSAYITIAEYNDWADDYPDDYDWNEADFYPQEGNAFRHGTHVAGIISADKNDMYMHGVAFSNAKILATRWDFMSSLSQAMIDTIDAGAKVINLSLGVDADSTVNASKISDSLSYLESFVLDGVRYAKDKSVVMVMSAGNESYQEPGLYNGIPLLPEFSDSLKNLFLTVVAVNNSGVMPAYSNKCGSTAAYCIAAPGGDLTNPIYSTSTYEQVLYANKGTSMAAGVVTGSIALLMGAYPYMTPQQVVELILTTANKDGVYGNSSIYGNGLLDLDAATNPQGYLATISGDNLENSAKVNVASTKMYVPSALEQSLKKKMPKTMTAFDKYNRPFEVDMSDMVKATHGDYKRFKNDLYNFSRHKEKQKVVSGNWGFGFAPSSFSNNDSGLGFVNTTYQTDDYASSFFFAEDSKYMADDYYGNATMNPFLAMNEVYGLENKIHFDDFDFRFAFMTGENGLYDGDSSYHDYDFDDRAYAFDMGIEYPLMPELALNVVGGMLAEDSALLGMNGSGALGIENSSTFYAGFLLGWQPIQNLTLSWAYYHGWTNPTHNSKSMLSTSMLLSDSFAFDAHYNFNKTNVLGFQISSPLRVYDGYADFDIATGRDNYSDTVYRKNVRASLRPSAREYRFAVYHNRELLEKIMFKSEMAVRLNPEHQSGVEPDYRAMFGLSWSF